MPQAFHKLELKRMLTTEGVKPADIIRIRSAGDSGLGVQEVLFVSTDGKPCRALIDRPTHKDKARVDIYTNWDV